jgi:hypothetical protein
MVLGDQRLSELEPMGFHARERPGLVQPDQPAVAHDVHGQNGRELAIHTRGHAALANASERFCNEHLQSRGVPSQRRRDLIPDR